MATQQEYEWAYKLFTSRINDLLYHLKHYGVNARITCDFRTDAQQETLYSIGRTRPGKIVTKLRPGSSPHNHNLARDFAIFYNGKCDWNAASPRWRIFGHCVRLSKLTWGGSWKHFPDFPHVELPNWRRYKVK